MSVASSLPILFDCDGVILDSNEIKVQAFRVALDGQPSDRVDRFIVHHRATGGVSRYEKLNRYYADAGLSGDGLEAAVGGALERFSAYVREALADCPMVPGANDLLGRLGRAGRKAYLVSGGDQQELRAVFAQRGLEPHFVSILGSPVPKDKHLSRLRDAGVLEAGGVFVGDARLDMEVADAFGLDFVFVAGVSDWPQGREVAAAAGHLVVEDLTDPAVAKLLGL